MTPTSANLWHGYSMDDIDRLTRTAAIRARGGRILDPGDRYETAWSAIAEHLATTDTPPTTTELLTIGLQAVNRAGQDHRHTWGMTRTWGAAEGDVAAYRRYWELDRRVTGSPEDPVVDRTALAQIWPRLSPTHQQVLWALALHDGDHRGAAESLGKSLVTYRSHLKGARAAYRALWHEHETPSRMWGKSGQQGRRTATQVLANRRQQRARRTATAT
jgi:DNA-directed RNA polymerase specialized sigma24 family protein